MRAHSIPELALRVKEVLLQAIQRSVDTLRGNVHTLLADATRHGRSSCCHAEDEDTQHPFGRPGAETYPVRLHMTRSFFVRKGVLRPGCGTGLAAIISGDHYSLVSSIPSQKMYTASLIIVLRVTITTHKHNTRHGARPAFTHKESTAPSHPAPCRAAEVDLDRPARDGLLDSPFMLGFRQQEYCVGLGLAAKAKSW